MSDREMSDLEKQFREIVAKVTPRINTKLEEAEKLISQAEKLADKHGVPFTSSVSPLGQGYKPASFDERFGKLRELDDESEDEDGPNFQDLMEEILGFTPGGEYDTEGWEHSSVC